MIGADSELGPGNLFATGLVAGGAVAGVVVALVSAKDSWARAIGRLSLEHNLFRRVGAALIAKGHVVRAADGGAVGGYQGIFFARDLSLPEPRFDARSVTEDLPVNGVYRAGSDHRKDGQAVGW